MDTQANTALVGQDTNRMVQAIMDVQVALDVLLNTLTNDGEASVDVARALNNEVTGVLVHTVAVSSHTKHAASVDEAEALRQHVRKVAKRVSQTA